ncbi:P-loop NTPase family protein [Nisaea sediminum]|uniref:hypothetical protein n=1 Tax=Nisaea sediminum TaxID=2775867 RepID=UPI0018660415|nr:hypothetical protein [Nisaea sediminum]
MTDPASLPQGIHVLGASGSGTSTFGRAWAERFGYLHLDTDDFYWLPTEPRFLEKRTVPERLRLLTEAIDAAERWILTGSLVSWGEPLVERFDLVVFVYTPFDLRMDRLIAREEERYGVEALQPGGAHYDAHMAFIEWAASYDTAGLETRSRRAHEAWMARLPCPVIRVSGTDTTARQIEQVAGSVRELDVG